MINIREFSQRMRQYQIWCWFINVMVAVDQLFNAILGGDPDETLSSRMGKQLDRCRLCIVVCNLLHWFDPDHCLKSIEAEEGKDSLRQ